MDIKPIIDLNPSTYARHAIHGEERIWAETNCYVDVLVELIHSLGYDPVAGLAFTLSVDFEEDQWTFFKYPPGDLLELYGLDIQELNPWKNLVEHVANQVHAAKPVLVELDSYFLPDTAGSAYKQEHVKSTVAVNAIDINKKFMGYFHGQGYYELNGDDFDNIFQLNGLVHERMLPPYIELVKTRGQDQSKLFEKSLVTFERHIPLMPELNPFEKFKLQFEQDLKWLLNAELEAFHKYSFASLRQYGACFELSLTYLQWLQQHGKNGLDDAITACRSISETAKAFQFQLARSIMRKKPLNLEPLENMASQWLILKSTLRNTI